MPVRLCDGRQEKVSESSTKKPAKHTIYLKWRKQLPQRLKLPSPVVFSSLQRTVQLWQLSDESFAIPFDEDDDDE
jgi:hypothetical protein